MLKSRTLQFLVVLVSISFAVGTAHFTSTKSDEALKVGTVVVAQQPSPVRLRTLTELVENNVYLFIPGDNSETGDDDQLDRVLQNLGEKYRITGLVITERRRNTTSSGIVLVGITQARIIVEPR